MQKITIVQWNEQQPQQQYYTFYGVAGAPRGTAPTGHQEPEEKETLRNNKRGRRSFNKLTERRLNRTIDRRIARQQHRDQRNGPWVTAHLPHNSKSNKGKSTKQKFPKLGKQKYT